MTDRRAIALLEEIRDLLLRAEERDLGRQQAREHRVSEVLGTGKAECDH